MRRPGRARPSPVPRGMSTGLMPDTDHAVEPRPDTHPLSLSMDYLGHSTVLIDIGGVRVLTDPILRRRVGPLVRAGAPVDPASWSRVDVVLISHSHWDHLDYGSLRLLGSDVPIVVPRAASGTSWRSCPATTSGSPA
jgi:L-ascorbate metabolism protein UlaG (beta-lactamase superfamily)